MSRETIASFQRLATIAKRNPSALRSDETEDGGVLSSRNRFVLIQSEYSDRPGSCQTDVSAALAVRGHRASVYDVARLKQTKKSCGEPNKLPTISRIFHDSFRLIVFGLAMLSIVSLSFRTAAQPRSAAVVFAVSFEGDEGSMDAVAVVNGGRLQHPYNDEQEQSRAAFGKKYFAAGKIYRLIFGGGDAGTVKVNSWDLGCNNIHAKVTPNTVAKLGGKVMALATTSETLGKRQSTRRAPT